MAFQVSESGCCADTANLKMDVTTYEHGKLQCSLLIRCSILGVQGGDAIVLNPKHLCYPQSV